MMPDQLIEGPVVEVPAAPIEEFYSHGWHSWCRTGWVTPATRWRPIEDHIDRLGHDDPVLCFDAEPGGSALGAIDHGGGDVSLLGALALGGWVSLVGNKMIGRSEEEEGRWFFARGDRDQVFSAYAAALEQRYGKRGGSGMRVWSSWYGYREDIDADRITGVVAGLGDLPFDVLQIDDGWQRDIGDWMPNARFPEGLGPLASEIMSTGRRPGIWVAPFIAARDSELATRDPDVLLRDGFGDPVIAGENWGAPYYALDVTHPATQSHVRGLVGGLRDLGFSFFKLDFVYAAAFPGRHHEEVGRETAYRRGLELVRQETGEDAYLLACGAPIVASLGVCDGIRVGPDVGPWWVDPDSDSGTVGRGVRNAVETTINRLWLRPLIDTDPDVVYFRERGIELDAITRRRLQLLAHVAGFRGVSDPPDWLTDTERRELEVFLAESPEVVKTSRYGWVVGEARVYFSPALTEPPARAGGA